MAAPFWVLMRDSAMLNTFVSERGQQVVEQSDSVRRLNLDQGVGRMRLVIDCDPGRKFEFVQSLALQIAPGLFEQRTKLECFDFESIAERVFHPIAIALFGNRSFLQIANAKNSQHGLVSSRKNVRAQNIERNNRERSGDFRQQIVAVPGAKGNDAMAELRKLNPTQPPVAKRGLRSADVFSKKDRNKTQMFDDVGNVERAKVIVRHEIEVGVDFVRIIGRQFRRHCRL